VVQVLAGLYLAFAIMNWTIKASVIGGIYHRPLALGNFTHFFIGTLVLLNYLFAGNIPLVLVIATLVYAFFPIGEDMAAVLKIVDVSGLPYQRSRLPTIIEGEWEAVIRIIQACHEWPRICSDYVVISININMEKHATETR
jgi:uncharacterized protein YqgV (UPF0045/DUF77 family)